MTNLMRRAAVVLVVTCVSVFAPATAQDQPAASQETLSPQQLESLVAPIALYPDSMLSQVLVASTYPLEVVEAQQWLDQNKALQGPALIDAAKKQNWDPSIQALVPFPDVLKRLNSDVRWTTDLGNAFLAQQADVMAAIQRLRQKAKESGKLKDDEHDKVVTENKNGQSAIEIQPVDPQVVYVPVYDPVWVWGPAPVLYPWPPLFYGGIGFGWGWGIGINLGFFFPGCCGWGGWGWGFGWFGGGVIVENHFFHRYGFREFHGSEFHAQSAWVHNPAHRGAVPYPHSVAGRYPGGGQNFRGAEARPSASEVRSNMNRAASADSNHHSAFGGAQNGGDRARANSDHGFSSMGAQRAAPAFHGGGFDGGRVGGGGGGRRR